jgi:hypothetical protein
MTVADNHIVETYSYLLEGLSATHKIELIESLAKSLKKDNKIKDERFYSSFGAWESDKSAEEIAAEIKMSRKFRNKEIKL